MGGLRPAWQGQIVVVRRLEVRTDVVKVGEGLTSGRLVRSERHAAVAHALELLEALARRLAEVAGRALLDG